MSDFENAFGRYRPLQDSKQIESGRALLATRIGVDGFEKQVLIRRVSDAATPSASTIAAAMLEARQCASLSHANVAQVLDLGTVDGGCFVATEYVSGPTLAEVFRARPGLRWPAAVHVAREVAVALSYAHARRAPNGELLRLVHRRLTPSRISLSSAGDVKVTGFGTSWAWPPLGDYRSPEEARGEPLDGRADVFALGAILRRCLCPQGSPPDLDRLVGRALESYRSIVLQPRKSNSASREFFTGPNVPSRHTRSQSLPSVPKCASSSSSALSSSSTPCL